jgi:hypothetical protein
MRLRALPLALAVPLALIVPLALLALAPASAAGDGPPTIRGAGAEGVLDKGTSSRFVALPAGHHTVLARVSTSEGGRIQGVGVVHGDWGVPVVAEDGTTGGLAAGVHTLVLMQPAKRLPRRVSRFGIVDTRFLRVTHKLILRGDWSYDALSPDAATLYLTQTLDRNRTRYAVRAYDLRANRLIKRPVVDPSEPDEPLRGLPTTRVTGPGGRWEYTLYLGGPEPFVHALDTVKRTSICIDLPRRLNKSRHPFDLELELRGSRIAVVDGERTVAQASRKPEAASAGGGPPWVLALVIATGLLAAAGVRRAARAA